MVRKVQHGPFGGVPVQQSRAMPRIKSRLRAVVGTLALIPIALAPACAVPGPGATVVSIGDGDTITVRMAGEQVTVRLACIDAPEASQRPDGQHARRYLQQRLSLGSRVRLVEKTTDRHGRLVAEVFNASNINLMLVADGQAFAYRRYLGTCDAREYLAAEERARRRRYGVWQVEGGITRPWHFRRQRRSVNRGQQGN